MKGECLDLVFVRIFASVSALRVPLRAWCRNAIGLAVDKWRIRNAGALSTIMHSISRSIFTICQVECECFCFFFSYEMSVEFILTSLKEVFLE